MRSTALRAGLVLALAAALAAPEALATAPAVGPLPAGPVSTVGTKKGELVAIALPHAAASSGRVWRLARAYNSRVVRQVSEADVGDSVVVVYKAVGVGRTSIVFALTRGETAKAFKARTYALRVSAA
jgi:hypothetical protein